MASYEEVGSIAVSITDPAARMKYENFRENILSRDQVASLGTMHDLLKMDRPIKEILSETVRSHAPYTHVPYHQRIDGGIVLKDGEQMGDDGDMLAAFDADDNVRGVALMLFPPFGPYQDTPVFELQMRSNDAGDLLTFKYYDASADAILDISETYAFETNAQLGLLNDPYDLNILTTVDLSIDLNAGWNWISFNVVPEDATLNTVLAGLSESATFIASQSSGISNNYGEWGWQGSLAELDPTEMYKLDMASAATLTITGVPVDVASTPIALSSGWNWIGYLPQNAGALDVALASVSESAAFIASQGSGVSTNYGEWGWNGSLSTLDPGSGYLLDMNDPDDLVYPEFDGLARLADNKQEVILTETISDWDFNYADYEFIGTITASIENHEDSEGDIIAAFVGDECRGMAERMYFSIDESYYYIIQVYSNVIEGEELTFKYYDKLNDEVVEYTETIEFTDNMVVGDGFNTMPLTREFIIPVEFSLKSAYPNPFNPVTTLEFGLPIEAEVSLSVYNLQGKEVISLIDGNMDAGYHSVVWNADVHASGAYFVKVVVGEYVKTQKLILIK